MESNIDDKAEPDTEVNAQATDNNRLKNELDASVKLKNEDEAGNILDLMQKPEIDFDHFFKFIDSSIQGLKEYKLIVSALELGVFEALKSPLSAGELAEKLGCDPLLMPHFCEALHGLGFLDRFEEGINKEEEKAQIIKIDAIASQNNRKPETESENHDNGTKNGDAVYLVSELSATYLLKSSPFSQQHYLAERLRNVERWARLPQIIKQGPDVVDKGPFFGEVVHCMAENARCGLLQETVQVVMENVDFTNVKRLLDIGGGHGLYAIAFSKLNEDLQAFVFDLPPVTGETRYFIEKYGASRVETIPGDFFKDELGSGYDLIFSSFNPGGKVPSLIPKLSKALNTGGIFVTRQMPDEKMKSSPLISLDWNLWTFEGVKKGGSGYSFENSVPFNEYIEMLGNYGLEVFRTFDMTDGSRIVFARKTT
ncbi:MULTISPECIES: methyltransferase [Methanosarcina]|uniref:O-methyltransferase n=3 Tax=Methanosarcina barkeri TaxID=2208 RepID=A0A0E3QUU6_METBA|nr:MULTISPECIES: methyltransferase [Methanosarcina]AKB54374.1 O-methyltransferase [Methanosarcina barkeri MS]AKB57549.1 O-methyltransferase [Methanosarcina barkeri 227]AKJ38099.1 SAM-dependent methyltransferase [Methanosarcina barkeri CM1]OED04825.1 SAM-dependent methyltransferase [Methanosarcina sp. A14]